MIGIDILDVERMEKEISRKGFVDRLFFQEEIQYANSNSQPAIHFAGFFCVKESVVKAVGAGLVSEVKVLHNEHGKPYVELYGKIKEIVGNRRVEVSITHAIDYAMAVCRID